jgi:hypothetical protein
MFDNKLEFIALLHIEAHLQIDEGSTYFENILKRWPFACDSTFWNGRKFPAGFPRLPNHTRSGKF